MQTIDHDDPIRMRGNPWPFVAIAAAMFIAFMCGMAVTYKRDMKQPDFRKACSLTLTDANGSDVRPIPEIMAAQ